MRTYYSSEPYHAIIQKCCTGFPILQLRTFYMASMADCSSALFRSLAVLCCLAMAMGELSSRELVVIDCQQNIHVLSANDLLQADVALSSTFLNTMFTFLRTAILERVKCHCPNLAASGKADSFFSLDILDLLIMVDPSEAQQHQTDIAQLCDSISGTDFSFSMADIPRYFRLFLPSNPYEIVFSLIFLKARATLPRIAPRDVPYNGSQRTLRSKA